MSDQDIFSNRNPDLYLRMIEGQEKKETKGKLKIFFGYAAGVGKTYAMLSAVTRDKKAGLDVVAGYIEPHARPDTKRKAEGLEKIPPKKMQINKITVNEMDLDAILLRKPEIVLVDEMAHTNADGCRHPKRYQDIAEILKAGIDVYTTLNVQHIESVHDKVAAITGIAVRERIPDDIFDSATQIEMIDIPPAELIERLHSGKIYKTDQAQRALGNFFSVENLTALREIALRRMADWLNREQDEALISDRRENASEHIMMCLSPSPSNAKVIRQAARMANAFHGKLTAFYVETSGDSSMDTADELRLQENRKLAEHFGAKVVSSFGNDIVEQIAQFAKVARVTKIVLGRSYTKRTLFSMKESMSERLASLVPNLEIFLIPDTYDKRYVKKKGSRSGKSRIAGLIYSIAVILAFDFFFTELLYTFHVNEAGYFITFFVVSLVILTLVKKEKSVARQNVEKAYRMSILWETSQILQQDTDLKAIGADTAKQLGKLLNRSICCFIGNPEKNFTPVLYELPGKRIELSEQECAVAIWSYKNNKSAGASTSTLPGAKNLFLTIRNGEKIFGLVGIRLEGRPLSAFEESVMLSMLNESALAFEKEESRRQNC